MSDTAIHNQADSPTLHGPPARAGRAGGVGAVRAWVAATVGARLGAALLSGIVPVLIAVGWLLRLVPALDVELADMEEHEGAATTIPPDADG